MTDEQLAQLEDELDRWSGLEPHFKIRLGRLWADEFHMYANDLIAEVRRLRQETESWAVIHQFTTELSRGE